MAFPPWINTFGGSPLWPASISYIAYDLVALGKSIVLEFPQVATTDYVVAGTMYIKGNLSGSFTVTMPDVTIVSPGYVAWIKNIGVGNLTIKKADATTLVVIGPGVVYSVQVIDNTTTAGTWATVQFGAGSSSVSAAALVGPGLTVDPLNSLHLATNITAREFSTGGYTVQQTDRAILLAWTGGTDTIFLPTIVGNAGFLFYLSNLGTGILTIQPSVGGQQINKQNFITAKPGDSFTISCGDLEYYTIGDSGFTSSAFTFPDGSIGNPSLNFSSDTTSGYSHSYTTSATQALNFSLHGVLQFSLATLASTSHAFFTNDVQATSYNSIGIGGGINGRYVFGNDPTKTRIELNSLGAPENSLQIFVYTTTGIEKIAAEFDTRGFLNLPQADFERDAISYAAWMRAMI